MAASLAAPDLTEFPRPPGAFTSRLPTGRSPFPPLDMTTTATGLLCWRDFHPQEWQLASLHHILRAGMAVMIGDVLPQPAPERLDGHQIGAVARQRHQRDVQGP